MKPVLRIIALALFIVGCLWTLQGLGLLAWPEGGFMIDRREWAVCGALLAALGVAAWWLSGRFDLKR